MGSRQVHESLQGTCVHMAARAAMKGPRREVQALGHALSLHMHPQLSCRGLGCPHGCGGSEQAALWGLAASCTETMTPRCQVGHGVPSSAQLTGTSKTALKDSSHGWDSSSHETEQLWRLWQWEKWSEPIQSHPREMADTIRSLLLPPLTSPSQKKSPSPPKGHSTLVLHEMTLGGSSQSWKG